MFSSYNFAGAWGVGGFENDSAMDWVYELESTNSVVFLSETLNNVKKQGYIEIDNCSSAIAAAEIVASINKNSLSLLPSEVKAWVKKHSITVTSKLKTNAMNAVSSCSDSKNSELAQLWE
jgi:hypothetical protein